MAIDTDTEKLALMEWGLVWEPGLPLSPGTLDQADQQQLLWGYPGVLWVEVDLVAAAPVFIAVADEPRTIAVAAEARTILVPDAPGDIAVGAKP